jgi:vacuolar protein sorting-associated protein 29
MSSGSSFGELVLVLGDLHVPERASKIPANFLRMLVPNKMQHVICTGNVGHTSTAPSTSGEQKTIYAKLQELAPHVHVVCGDYDSEADFPETRVVQVGMFRIGVIHGHQLVPWKCKEALQRMRRKLQVDVLVSGHTHQSEVVIDNGYCYINPVRSTLQLLQFTVSFFRLQAF